MKGHDVYRIRTGSQDNVDRQVATRKVKQRIVDLPPRPLEFVTIEGVEYQIVWCGYWAGPEQCGLPPAEQRGRDDWNPPRERINKP